MLSRYYKASALLTALFITAIAAIMATAVIYKFRIMVHLATLNNFSNQATLYLDGVLSQAEFDFSQYANSWANKPNADSPNLQMPRRIGPQQFSGLNLEARLIDAQGLYNINNLVSANNQLRFINLLHYILPKLTFSQDRQLAQHITNWLTPGNADDQIYARRSPPYRGAHHAMTDISELRLVAGITPMIYTALKPYITALPTQQGQMTKVNINTAAPAVLLTLSSQMTSEKAQSLYQCTRGHGVFFSTAAYNKTCVTPLGIGQLNGITVNSSYFLVYSAATTETQQVLLNSLLGIREDNNSQKRYAYVIWQLSG